MPFKPNAPFSQPFESNAVNHRTRVNAAFTVFAFHTGSWSYFCDTWAGVKFRSPNGSVSFPTSIEQQSKVATVSFTTVANVKRDRNSNTVTTEKTEEGSGAGEGGKRKRKEKDATNIYIPLQVQGQGHLSQQRQQHQPSNSETSVATSAESASDAQLNGSSSTPMDTSVTTATSSSSSVSVGGSVAAVSSLASLMPPSSFTSLAASGAAGPGGITTLSNSTSGTTTTTAGTIVGSSLTGDQQNTIGKDGTTGNQPASTSVSASVAISTTTTSVANSSSTTTTSTTTSLSAAITAAIATVTGTLAVPVSNIGANGVLSTGSGSITTASSSISAATTTSVSSPGAGLPPPTQSKAGVNSDKGGIPKATIKPNVLTHVIEGYVIQEANEPFAVQRQRYPERDTSDEPPKKRSTNEANSPLSPSSAAAAGGGDSGNCEVCGKSELRSKMKRKRFCSVSCARSAKQNSTEQISSPVQNGTVGNGGSALVDTVMNGGAVTTLPTPMVVAGADPSLNQLTMLGSSPTAVVHSNVKLEMKDAYGQPAPQQQQQLPGVLGAATPFAQQQQQQQQQQQLLLQQQQSAAATLLTAAAAPLTVGTAPTGTGMLLSTGDVAAPGGPQTPTGLAAAAAAAAAASEENSSILRWTVQDVYEFIRALPGCADYAEDFVNQEIDGQALLLLKENHLVSTMDMKLGPALKIVARVNLMKTAIAPPEGQ